MRIGAGVSTSIRMSMSGPQRLDMDTRMDLDMIVSWLPRAHAAVKLLAVTFPKGGADMSDSLNVNPDGLRSAAARSDDLASELDSSNGAGSGGGSQPTASAVQAVHALISGVRADHAAYLSGRSNVLKNGANGYQNTDDGSANKFKGTM